MACPCSQDLKWEVPGLSLAESAELAYIWHATSPDDHSAAASPFRILPHRRRKMKEYACTKAPLGVIKIFGEFYYAALPAHTCGGTYTPCDAVQISAAGPVSLNDLDRGAGCFR